MTFSKHFEFQLYDTFFVLFKYVFQFIAYGPVARGFKKEEIIYKYFIVLIDSLRYKKTKFKSATTLKEALGTD